MPSAWLGACIGACVGAWARGLVAALMLLLAWAAHAGEHLAEISRARVSTQIAGVVSHADVQLPYHWDGEHRGQQGFASFEMNFQIPAVQPQPYGMYISRLGNAYEVRLNGVLLARNGDMAAFNGADFAKAPRFIAIPADLLMVRNTIEVRIRADAGRRGGLTRPVVGTVQDVEPLYRSDYRWRVLGSLVVVVVSALVALIALSLWLTQVDVNRSGWARRDPLYFYAAVAEIFWTLRVGDALVENPPLPWLGWGMLTVMSAAIWAMGMALFCVEVAGWSQLPATRRLRRWLMLVLALGLPVSYAAMGYGNYTALTVWYGVGTITFIAFVAVFIWKALRSGEMAHKIMAVILMLNALVGLRDLVVFRVVASYGGNTLQRYSSILFGITLAYIVLQRFRTVSESAKELMVTLRELMANLSERVAEKEVELKASFAQLEALARAQERTEERTRILRDMHDGVGSHISAAIRQLESGQSSNALLLQTLRDSLDQLKLSIDALTLAPGDVTALLANLRYRLGPRFAAMNLALEWDVQELPHLAHLDAAAMRQLQFIVFEAFSNVMQHARATTLRIEAAVQSSELDPALQELCIRISDNGVGFDAAATNRRGLDAMAGRADAIGARLQISSRAGGTVTELCFALPVEKEGPGQR